MGMSSFFYSKFNCALQALGTHINTNSLLLSITWHWWSESADSLPKCVIKHVQSIRQGCLKKLTSSHSCADAAGCALWCTLLFSSPGDWLLPPLALLCQPTEVMHFYKVCRENSSKIKFSILLFVICCLSNVICLLWERELRAHIWTLHRRWKQRFENPSRHAFSWGIICRLTFTLMPLISSVATDIRVTSVAHSTKNVSFAEYSWEILGV